MTNEIEPVAATAPFDAEEFVTAASCYLLGGLSSPVRRRMELGNRPFYVARGEGAYVWDENDKRYLDLNCGHGSVLLGHSHPALREAMQRGIDMGMLCGQETVLPARVAQRLTEMIPGAERVRFLLTGKDATALAVRVARAHTGKLKVIKFEGHYHGVNDPLAFNNWPPPDQSGPRSSPSLRQENVGGIPEVRNYTSVLPWNDLELLEALLKREAAETAAVIMEPINYNSGCILPVPGYLEGVRELTRQHGVLLIFDEILSGFRTGPGCAQGYFGVTPDLSTLGKALAGGVPLAALVGRQEVMETLAPIGDVMDQGTYYGHPLAMHAAEAFLEVAGDPERWVEQERIEQRLYGELHEIFRRYNAGCVQAVGNRFSLLFGIDEPVQEWRQAALVDRELALRFHAAAFERGVCIMHGWHHGFSWVHTEDDIDFALAGIEAALQEAVKG